jgi:hypothetical protein
MPKKIVTGEAEAGERLGMTALPTWQATGLSLAVIVGHVFNGSGALVFGLLSVGVIWTLHRLHTHAPGSRTTADLIASVSGATPARAIAVVQFVAYALIGAYTAKSITSMALPWMTGPDTTIPGWSGPALGVATAAVGCLLVGALPTRLLAPAVTVLAAFSLLVFFYVALAVIARVLSGTAPVKPIMEFGTTPAAAEWGPAALLISLAIAFAGFEIPTSASDRLRSVRRPLGGAMALATLCAALAWVATNLGSTGEFRYDAADLVLIAGQMFGGTGTLWLLAAAIAGAVAALLVLIWGATLVVQPPIAGSVLPLTVTAVVTGLLVLAVSISWGDGAAHLWGVAGILLLGVYVAAAQANSRLDDENSTAWALFALMAMVFVVAVFLMGASQGWWPSGIAIAIVAAAAVWALKSPAGATPSAALHAKGRQPGGLVDRQVRQHRRGEAARPRVQPAEQPAPNAGDQHGADHRLSGGAGVDDVP